MIFARRITLVAVLGAAAADSVQLFTNATQLPSAMSETCKAALLGNISCAQLVSPRDMANTASYGALGNATLTELCTAGCAGSLASYRDAADSACGNGTYTFGSGDDQSYEQSVPAIVEPYVWAHSVACVQVGSVYCVPQLANTTSACADCFLAYEAAIQGSAYGQALVAPDDFAALLSSCSVPASSYPTTSFAAPTSTSNATTTTSATATATCLSTSAQYPVVDGDSCLSIAAAKGVATDRLIAANGLDYNCTVLAAGQTLCIPETCALHVVQTNDSCSALLANVTYYQAQLVSWNPYLHSTCDNLDAMVGRAICVSPPGTAAWDVVAANHTTSWNVTFFMPTTSFASLPNQTNTVVQNYTTSYQLPLTPVTIVTTTQTFDPAALATFDALTEYCPITEDEAVSGWTIYDLPDDCLDALQLYCEPDDGNSTAPASTVFPTTCSPAYWDAALTSTSSSLVATTTKSGGAPGPTQSGVAATCNDWQTVVANDTCAAIADEAGISLAQFYGWNPAVGSDCEALNIGYSVCIGVAGGSSSATATATTTKPSPIMPSTDPDCTSYYYVTASDSCAAIETAKSISPDQFNAWNPYIGTDCTNLWASEYICVGAPYTSTTVATPTTTSPSSTTPSPLMPSTDAKCTKWHDIVSGDSCYDIEQTYAITAEKFDAWNPYVGSDCASLWLGYYVCVAAPN